MGMGVMRPCLYISIENPEQPHLRTQLIPMVMDTGSDQCVFARELAPEIGIDVDRDGGRVQRVFPLGGEPRLVREYKVQIVAPQIERRFLLLARFDTIGNGSNGVLGYGGFLNFLDVRFVFKTHFQVFDIRSNPPYGGMPL